MQVSVSVPDRRKTAWKASCCSIGFKLIQLDLLRKHIQNAVGVCGSANHPSVTESSVVCAEFFYSHKLFKAQSA